MALGKKTDAEGQMEIWRAELAEGAPRETTGAGSALLATTYLERAKAFERRRPVAVGASLGALAPPLTSLLVNLQFGHGVPLLHGYDLTGAVIGGLLGAAVGVKRARTLGRP